MLDDYLQLKHSLSIASYVCMLLLSIIISLLPGKAYSSHLHILQFIVIINIPYVHPHATSTINQGVTHGRLLQLRSCKTLSTNDIIWLSHHINNYLWVSCKSLKIHYNHNIIVLMENLTWLVEIIDTIDYWWVATTVWSWSDQSVKTFSWVQALHEV